MWSYQKTEDNRWRVVDPCGNTFAVVDWEMDAKFVAQIKSEEEKKGDQE